MNKAAPVALCTFLKIRSHFACLCLLVIFGIILGRLTGNIDRFTKPLLEGIVKIKGLTVKGATTLIIPGLVNLNPDFLFQDLFQILLLLFPHL